MKKINMTSFTLCAMLSAMLCLMGPLSVPTASGISFTLGLAGVFLCGALQKPIAAVASVVCYLAVGLAGLPVFSSFQAGPAAIFGPTGGFLLSYPVVSAVVSLIRLYAKKRPVTGAAAGMILSLPLCYGTGSMWYCVVTGNPFASALVNCVLPFILFDAIKIFLVTLVFSAFGRRRHIEPIK